MFPPSNAITPYPEATNITVGNEYYQLSKWLPSGLPNLLQYALPGLHGSAGTHMVWGVNLGFNNVTNAVNMAKAIVNAFLSPEVINSGVVLERIEVGRCHRLHY